MNLSKIEPFVEILGVKINCLDMQGVIKKTEEFIAQGSPRLICTANVDHLIQLQKDSELQKVYQAASLIIPDGMPLVWVSRLLGPKITERVTGIDFLEEFAKVAAKKGYRLFFLGGTPKIMKKAARTLKKRHPRLQVATYPPPFGKKWDRVEDKKILRAIKKFKPHVLFVGVGAPRQENWIYKHWQALEVPVSIGVGAAFDFLTGAKKRTPKWMQKAGLEWLFRLFQEPRRLWRRYLRDLKFPFLVSWQILREKSKVSTFLLLLFVLGILPFLDGGTSPLASYFLFLLVPILILTLGKRLKKDLPFKFFFPWSLFLIFATLSTIFSISYSRSVPTLFFYFSYFLIFSLALFLFDSPARLKALANLILLIGFLLSILSFYYLLPLTKPPASTMTLVYASFGHNHLSDYLIFVFPLIGALFLTTKKKKESIFYGLVLLFFLFSLLLTFSRGAVFVVGASLFLITVWIKGKLFLKKKLLLAVALLLILGLLIIFILPKLGILDEESFDYGSWLTRQLTKPPTWERRLDYWGQAKEIFKNRPLLGTGLDTFRLGAIRYQKRPISWSWYTHNHFLEAFAETGIFGGFTFLWLIGLIIYASYKNIQKKMTNPYALGLFVSLLSSGLHSLIDYDWQFPAVFATFLAIGAGLVGFNKKSNRRVQKPAWGLILVLTLTTFAFGTSKLLGDFYYKETGKIKFYPWDVSRQQAVGDFNRAIFLSPQDSALHQRLAGKYLREKRLEEAKREFELVILYNPLDDPNLYLKLGEIYKNLGEEEKERKLLLSYVEKVRKLEDFGFLTTDVGKLHFALAKLYFEKGDFEKSLGIFGRAVKIDPWTPAYYSDLGVLEKGRELRRLGQNKEAENLLYQYTKKVRHLTIKHFDKSHRYVGKIYRELADIYFKEGEIEKGIDAFKMALETDPWTGSYYYELGGILVANDQIEEAKAVYRMCLEFFPQDNPCRRGLERLD